MLLKKIGEEGLLSLFSEDADIKATDSQRYFEQQMTADCATIQHLKKTPSFNFVCSGQTVKTNGRKMNGFSSDDDDDAAFLFWMDKKKPSGPFFIF